MTDTAWTRCEQPSPCREAAAELLEGRDEELRMLFHMLESARPQPHWDDVLRELAPDEFQ